MDDDRSKGAVLSSQLQTVAETGSTNADMLLLAAAGQSEGSWLRADRQTGGRGRQGRHWVSPPGNFYASTIVRVRPADPPAATLAMVAAVALEEVVSALLAEAMPPRALHELEADGGKAVEAPTALLKWPNDVLVASAKLSGILLERSQDAVVIGIGVNLAHHPAGLDRPVTSLAAQGVAVTPAAFLTLLAPALSRQVACWRTGLPRIVARWLGRAHPVGTPLSVELPDGDRVSGRFAGLDDSGALLLLLPGGGTRVVHAGDVFLM